MGQRKVWRSVLGAVLLLAACSDGRGLYSGPEAHTPDEVLALFRDAGLSCGHEPDPMGDGPDDENECAPLGTGVEIITFADEQEQLDNLDTTCAEDSYEPPSRVVVVGRGWVLALNFLSGLNEAEPIADALNARAVNLCD